MLSTSFWRGETRKTLRGPYNEIKKYIPKACPIPLQRRSIIRIYYHFRGRERKRREKEDIHLPVAFDVDVWRDIHYRRHCYVRELPLFLSGRNAMGNKSDNISCTPARPSVSLSPSLSHPSLSLSLIIFLFSLHQ